jgi:hypothetical protein
MPRGNFIFLAIWLSCVVRNYDHCVWIVVAVTIAFAMGVLCVGWERGFGPAVSIRVVALAKAKGSAAFGGNS